MNLNKYLSGTSYDWLVATGPILEMKSNNDETPLLNQKLNRELRPKKIKTRIPYNDCNMRGFHLNVLYSPFYNEFFVAKS